jgi:hypothetical protein
MIPTHTRVSVTEAKKCASMFGVEVDPLLNAYCKPRVRVGTEWVNKGQNVEQVISTMCSRTHVCAGELGQGCHDQRHLQSSVQLARKHVQQDT